MAKTEIVVHSIPIDENIAKNMYEVIYNAALPDYNYGNPWFTSESEELVSYGFYEEEWVAKYIAEKIECGIIKPMIIHEEE